MPPFQPTPPRPSFPFPFPRALPFYCEPNMYAPHTSQNHAKNPSFSSSLLDKIYQDTDINFYAQTMLTKQTTLVQDHLSAPTIPRPCFVDKWKRTQKTLRKSPWNHHDHDHDHDHHALFLSSTSTSSASSSGLLSSPDTESLYGGRARVSCFAPSRPKPVMTSPNEEGFIKSKSRALNIYNNLKKVKQPISPGGRLSSFLNSLFATGTAKKTKTYDHAKPAKSGQDSTCSSASSFSRSCLSKASSSNKLRDGVKRTVRFYPVSVIVDEDCRPCGHKCLYEEDTRVMPVSVPTAWKIARNKSQEEEEEQNAVHKSRRVEETAREFLKEYHRTQNKSDLLLRDFPPHDDDDDDDDDDDAASYSSSDLFELDHLSLMGNNRYREELPVYETTHLSTNRAIANGLI